MRHQVRLVVRQRAVGLRLQHRWLVGWLSAAQAPVRLCMLMS